MHRLLICLLLSSFATLASGQITFRASSLDIEQNERLDAVENRVESIEESVVRIEDAVTRMVTDQAMALAVKPKPKEVAKPKPQPVSVRSNRYTQSELEAIVRSRYPRGFNGFQIRHADVSPRSAVWQHLKGGTHGFSSAQVDGLSQSVALSLHDMHHGGEITPYRGRTQVGSTAPERPAASVVQSYDTGCANGQCARQVTSGIVQRVRSVGPIRRLLGR